MMMNAELDELLCERYPSVFRDRHAPMIDTAMCWGFACGPGWFALIDTLCAEIQTHIDTTNIPAVVATQVKEKFGGLRFYTRGGDAYTAALTWFADTLSTFVCEECGAPALRTGDSWIKTRCARHGGEDFPLDAPSQLEAEDESAWPDRVRTERQAAWTRADAFRLPPPYTRGWRHVASALEHTIKNDIRHNRLPPLVITGLGESEALRYCWAGGDGKGWTAAMFRLADAYSKRCDRETGAPIY